MDRTDSTASFAALPSASEQFSNIAQKLSEKQLLLFFDYDGTLTPIVSQPEDAIISSEMKQLLSQLAEEVKVAVVSGRGLKDVKSKVSLDNLYYAGSHGFEAEGPEGLHFEHEQGKHILPVLKEAEEALQRELTEVEGVRVERKRFAIAIHYRNVADGQEEVVKQKADEVLSRFSQLKKGLGKKIVEFKPDIDWHKGRAVSWLVEKLDSGQQESIPVYIGDDITDEDAFRQVRSEGGLGILVGDHGSETYAQYTLKDVDEVKGFLRKLLAAEK